MSEMADAAAAIRAEADRVLSKAPTVRMATVSSTSPLEAVCDGSTVAVAVRAYVLRPEAGQRVALLRSGSAFYLLG